MKIENYTKIDILKNAYTIRDDSCRFGHVQSRACWMHYIIIRLSAKVLPSNSFSSQGPYFSLGPALKRLITIQLYKIEFESIYNIFIDIGQMLSSFIFIYHIFKLPLKTS